MATRKQVQHYIRQARQAEEEAAAEAAVTFPLVALAHAVATGCECHECRTTVVRPAPALVPDLVAVAGGHAVIVGTTVVDVIPFVDVWGNGR